VLAKEVCLNFLKNSLKDLIHAKRLNALFETSWSLTKEASLTLTSLGRHKDGVAYVKHKIKSVDRLLGNKSLQAEIPLIYKELFKPMLQALTKIFILVDWSGCCRSDQHVLRASVVHSGRSITIYNEIHPQAVVGNASIHRRFLFNLSKILPFGKQIIIITDGGFATPWFSEVKKRGWDFVGRVNRNMNILINGKWIGSNFLNKEATSRVHYIGTGRIGKKVTAPIIGSIYTFKQQPKNRKDKSKFPAVNKRYSKNSNSWILATSLCPKVFNGIFIKNIYKKRMQIEQNFRDDKSYRFGFGWRLGRTFDVKRIPILCLIACIATFFLWWMGLIAEEMGLQRRFQVNTVREKRVLSLPNLGRQFLYHLLLNLDEVDWHKAPHKFISTYEEQILCL
jgi:hypothetical protein